MASSAALIFLTLQCVTLALAHTCAFYNKRWHKAMGWCRHHSGELHIGDINYDHRADMLCHDKRTGYKWTSLSAPGGTFSGTSWHKAMGWCSHVTAELHLGDFNGDGKQDMLCHDIKTGYKWIALANHHGQYTGTSWHKAMGWCSHTGAKLFIGDFNGDRRSDMLCHDIYTGYKWIALADHLGHFHSTNWHNAMGWCSHNGAELLIGDFNGDHRSDMMCHDSKGQKWIALAKPAPHIGFSGTSWHRNMGWCSHAGSQLFIGDFNGDKLADMLCHDKCTGYKWIAYNHGPSTYFTSTGWHAGLGWCRHKGAKLFVADFDGDNRSDILCHDLSGKKWIIYNECK